MQAISEMHGAAKTTLCDLARDFFTRKVAVNAAWVSTASICRGTKA